LIEPFQIFNFGDYGPAIRTRRKYWDEKRSKGKDRSMGLVGFNPDVYAHVEYERGEG
jgi:hypothetical protein